MKLSIVATLYRSAAHIAEFHQRASAAARRLAGNDYEIVLVNDGSPDNSLDLAVQLAETDIHLVVVDLSRNFGHHKAMMTGLAHSKGDYVFLIDSDLEEEPEWLLDFSTQMHHSKCDVVYGVQEKRKGGLFERVTGQLFYRLFRALTRLDLPDNIVVARLMTRRYVDALLLHRESEVFMAGLWLITGFSQTPKMITKHDSSSTTYTLWKKISQLIDSITSFSNGPLVGIFVIGSAILFLAFLYTMFLVANWLFFAQPPDGYTSIMASVWLLGGLISAFIGIVGMYLSKIYLETKNRPYTIVRCVYGSQDKGDGA
jgi:putative glycosyltransferase